MWRHRVINFIERSHKSKELNKTKRKIQTIVRKKTKKILDDSFMILTL